MSHRVLDSISNEALQGAIVSLTASDGIPVAQIARLAGVAESTVYGWRSGDQTLSAAQYLRLSAGLLRHGCTRLTDLALDAGYRLDKSDTEMLLNGSIDDEMSELRMALADAVRADRAGSSEAALNALDSARTLVETAIREIETR